MKSIPFIQNHDPLDALSRAVLVAGGQSALARKCAVRPQTVQVWLKMGRLPAERVIQVEKIVNGKVSRHELRPDIYPE